MTQLLVEPVVLIVVLNTVAIRALICDSCFSSWRIAEFYRKLNRFSLSKHELRTAKFFPKTTGILYQSGILSFERFTFAVMIEVHSYDKCLLNNIYVLENIKYLWDHKVT